MLKLSFYVPESHLEAVKQAVFEAGAGRYDNYDSCCWQALGEGQFRPLIGSTPAIGKQNQIEKLPEYRVEMICEDECIEQVMKVFKAAHPYEVPAYHVVKLLDY